MLNKKALIGTLMLAGSLSALAQSSINSPYTRYGLGELSDRGFANNAAMGGVGYALRNSGHINMLNPASFTAVDSLSFMFDVGMSLKSSNFQENGIKNNAKNSSFDYIAMQFRLHPRLGMAIAFTPYSTLGYNFTTTQPVEGAEDVTATNLFYGDGGLQQITGGLGFKVLNNLSIGVNAGYIYGTLQYQSTKGFSVSSDQTNVYNNIKVNSYVADFGLQYTQKINKSDKLTLGLVYGLGHTLNSTDTRGIQVTDNSSYSSVNEHVINDSYVFLIPLVQVWHITMLKALPLELITLSKNGRKVKYENSTDAYNDRSKIAAGVEYLPNPIGRSYLKRIRYRAGGYYKSSYLKLPQCDGPSEYGISAGFGLPLQLFQRNTILNVTGQYVHVTPSVPNMLSEKPFCHKKSV